MRGGLELAARYAVGCFHLLKLKESKTPDPRSPHMSPTALRSASPRKVGSPLGVPLSKNGRPKMPANKMSAKTCRHEPAAVSSTACPDWPLCSELAGVGLGSRPSLSTQRVPIGRCVLKAGGGRFLREALLCSLFPATLSAGGTRVKPLVPTRGTGKPLFEILQVPSLCEGLMPTLAPVMFVRRNLFGMCERLYVSRLPIT